MNFKTELPSVQGKNRNGSPCEFHRHHLKKKDKEEEKGMEEGSSSGYVYVSRSKHPSGMTLWEN